ncbi:YibE/F family protein [Micrococcoides hystricis]|uniref:YibE/F family protein n=1 Tax=Micrococcoides hystricis TaxID=1572761 RepID=A0ABV6PAF4_9MICC
MISPTRQESRPTIGAGHSHSGPDRPRSARERKRIITALWATLVPVALATVAGLVLLWPSGSYQELTLPNPYGTAEGVQLVRGTITAVEEVPCTSRAILEDQHSAEVGADSAQQTQCQRVMVDPDGGGSEHYPMMLPPEVTASAPAGVGDRVRVLDLRGLPQQVAPGTDSGEAGEPGQPNAPPAQAGEEFIFVDFERSVPIILLGIAYAFVVVLVARWRGLRALVGLIGAFIVLAIFIIPSLLEGNSPMLVGLTGSVAIMMVVLYFAHGFSLRTTTALLGTLIGLIITAVLAGWGTEAAYLTGLGDEYSYVLASQAPAARLSGIILCGLLIAGLGVLNDVTITQSSAVWELNEMKPTASAAELFASAMRIGRDHIASTVYTIAFAYAGAALPVLMVVSLYDRSLWDMLISGELVEEIVRTLIGSIGLVLAIPATTIIAVLVVKAVASPTQHSLHTSQSQPELAATGYGALAGTTADTHTSKAQHTTKDSVHDHHDHPHAEPAGPAEPKPGQDAEPAAAETGQPDHRRARRLGTDGRGDQ